MEVVRLITVRLVVALAAPGMGSHSWGPGCVGGRLVWQCAMRLGWCRGVGCAAIACSGCIPLLARGMHTGALQYGDKVAALGRLKSAERLHAHMHTKHASPLCCTHSHPHSPHAR